MVSQIINGDVLSNGVRAEEHDPKLPDHLLTDAVKAARAHNEKHAVVTTSKQLHGGVEKRFLGVVSRLDVPKGGIIIRGVSAGRAPGRDVYSTEVDLGVHIYSEAPAFRVNHCCRPNTSPVTNDIGCQDYIALVDIAAGEEITGDYDTHELESIAVDECACGVKDCRKFVRGFSTRAGELMELYAPTLPRYLMDWHAKQQLAEMAQPRASL